MDNILGNGQPNLDGAVDLSHPIQQAGRNFLATMAQGGKSAVFIGIDGNNRIIVTNYTPGGMVEALGLATLGAYTLLHQQQHQQAQPQ